MLKKVSIFGLLFIALNSCIVAEAPYSCVDYEVVNLLQSSNVNIWIDTENWNNDNNVEFKKFLTPIYKGTAFVRYAKHPNASVLKISECGKGLLSKYKYILRKGKKIFDKKSPTNITFLHLKVEDRKKQCVTIDIDYISRDTVLSKYDQNRETQILALTKNGLEVISKEEYEHNKEKYVLDEKNIKCLNEK